MKAIVLITLSLSLWGTKQVHADEDVVTKSASFGVAGVMTTSSETGINNNKLYNNTYYGGQLEAEYENKKSYSGESKAMNGEFKDGKIKKFNRHRVNAKMGILTSDRDYSNNPIGQFSYLDSRQFDLGTFVQNVNLNASARMLHSKYSLGAAVINTENTLMALQFTPVGLLLDKKTDMLGYTMGPRVSFDHDFNDKLSLQAATEAGVLLDGKNPAGYLLANMAVKRKIASSGYVKLEAVYEGQTSKKDIESKNAPKQVLDTSGSAFTTSVSAGAAF